MKKPSKQLVVDRAEYMRLATNELQRPRLIDLLAAARELHKTMQDPNCTEADGGMLMLQFFTKVKQCRDIPSKST